MWPAQRIRCDASMLTFGCRLRPLMSFESLLLALFAKKAVELSGYFVVIKDGAYNRRLGSSSMVPEEVSKGDNSVLLFKVGICRLVSSLRCQISPHLARGRAATRLLAPALIGCSSPKRAFI
jgi:hypothetical protein